MAFIRKIFWVLLFGAATFFWVVLFEHGPGGFVDGIEVEFQSLTSMVGLGASKE